MLKFKLEETEKIKKLLIEIEALKIVFETIKSLSLVEKNLRRESLLKSSLFSARIEGNSLSLEKIKMLSEEAAPQDVMKLEVFNLLSAYRFLYSAKAPQKLSLNFIKKLHKLVLKNTSVDAGRLRTKPWAIFNQAGVAVYLAPSPVRLSKLMQDYLVLSHSLVQSVPCQAAILQFLFEKIHPFADGNGRVGRLISTYVMNKGGYGFRGLVSIEEMIDKNRQVYYQALEPNQEATLFTEFFLISFVKQAKIMVSRMMEVKKELPEDVLLPRRREVWQIIKDHPYCSFDFISRRFAGVNKKTLHYDLGQLQKKGFVIKVGKTRGVVYKAK